MGHHTNLNGSRVNAERVFHFATGLNVIHTTSP